MGKKVRLPLPEVYKLIESGPTLMITSALKGRPNVMTISWSTMLDFDPPLVACVIGRQSYTHQIIKKTKEFVINIPTVEMAKKVVGCGAASGKKVDKFAKFKLPTTPASKVEAPLIDECYCNIECRIVDTRMVGKYDLFIARAVAAWIRPSKRPPQTLHHASGRNFIVAAKRINVF